MRESKFQSDLIEDLHDMFPNCIVLKNDSNYIQGFPDLLILFENKWAALEVKPSRFARRQPNQEYYVDRLNRMSCAYIIYPENKEHVLNELQQTFELNR